MKDKVLSDGEVKAQLAQAEAYYSHYRWDEAIAAFESILASRPDHPVAAQGWANAVEQRSIDEDLREALTRARASLASDRFDEALAAVNQAQTRAALNHILKYHSELDGLRTEAQEGQEWQRRVEAAMREAEGLAGRRRFEQALETLDDTLRPLRARGWERLGKGLAALREKLWTERDVAERLQFAQAAYEREDYGLAAELAASLREELSGHEDALRPVVALHERARGAWGRLQERLAAVNEALAEARTDDALALLAALRAEHPRNPDWQAIALRVYIGEGRDALAQGRAEMAAESFEEAAEAFEAAGAAFAVIVEIFPEHPTATQEQAEAAALRQAALSAAQASRERAAFRWEASRQGWQASREHLNAAGAARGRAFDEVATVIDAARGETEAALADLEEARLMLADGRQALDARDAGTARETFRAGLSRVEGGRLGDAPHLTELREGLAAGLREAERIQRDVKKLLSQADAASGPSVGREGERLGLLRRAYERWETAPGVPVRLADELLAVAAGHAEAGDEDAALAYCEQVAEVAGAPADALSRAAELAASITAGRAARVAQAEAAEQQARAEAFERAVRPVVDALQTVDALCEPAADGDLAAVDWDAIEKALKDARRALREGRTLPQPLPPRWTELKARVEALERRNQLLRMTQERMAAGRGVEAAPALQAYAASDPDPVVVATLDSLVRAGSSDAADAARDWRAQAVSALERGELTAAAAYVALAQSYLIAAPAAAPEIRRLERQIALLTEARDRTREARAAVAAGDLTAALALYRTALEITADGEAGLPADARRAIHQALDAEETLDDENPSAPLGESSHPLVKEFAGPALGRWWRLARQAAALARVETQVALGQEAAAAETAAELAAAFAQPQRMVAAYQGAVAEAAGREARRWRRRLKRARRLAEQGAYAEALAEIEREPLTADAGGPQSDEVEELADEAAELRLELGKLLRLSEQLGPLLETMREAALLGQFDEALAARGQAEFLDPGRRAGALWDEMDGLAALIEQRRNGAPAAGSGLRPAGGQAGSEPAAMSVASAAPVASVRPEPLAAAQTGGPTAEMPRPAPVVLPPPIEARPARDEDNGARLPEQGDAPGHRAEVAQPAETAQPPASEALPEQDAAPVPKAEPALAEPPPVEPLAPFDLDDWLSNVTELSPEDAGPENGS